MRPLGGATGTDTGGDSMDATRIVIKEAVLQELGERLRDLRKSRKLRQLDMENLGLSYKYYQRLESGQVNPTLITLQKLADAFEVSVYDLFRPELHYDVRV
jgi:DNA-binding XRE family transcriptional regulator